MVRIDILLRQRFPEASRIFLQKLIRDGQVKVNGKSVQKPHQLIRPDDHVECDMPSLRIPHIQPRRGSLHIIFEDSDIIVLDKPAGISVHPSPTDTKDTLVSFLLAHCRNLSGIGGVMRPGIVHRLDKDTSGLLVVAKNDAAHRNLSAQFAGRKVKKEYVALVKGLLSVRAGAIEAPISRSMHDRKKMAVSARMGSREALTEFRVIKRFGNAASLVSVFPKTGRTHQIRVHFASIGHPVIGDKTYGKDDFGLKRQFLHAVKLEFLHPSTGKRVKFSSKIPEDLDEVLKSLKKGGTSEN